MLISSGSASAAGRCQILIDSFVYLFVTPIRRIDSRATTFSISLSANGLEEGDFRGCTCQRPGISSLDAASRETMEKIVDSWSQPQIQQAILTFAENRNPLQRFAPFRNSWFQAQIPRHDGVVRRLSSIRTVRRSIVGPKDRCGRLGLVSLGC